MKNLIIIPAYNESGNIENVVSDLKKNAPGFDYIIVNDCSRDNTLEICKKKHFKVLDLPVNLGIGGAVQAGYRYAYKRGYDTAVQFDGDGQHDAAYLGKMLEFMGKTGSNMVIGSRFIEKEGFQSSQVRRMGIKYFTRLIKLMTGHEVTDPTSGMRMVDKGLIKEFAESYPRDYPEPESVVTALEKGYKVSDYPVVMKERKEGKSSINMKAGLYYMIKVSLAIIMAKINK